MRTLAIETSCDETAVALLQFEADRSAKILSEHISSQIELHKLYGGVVPELAAREHMSSLPIITQQVLSESSLQLKELDCISVTLGPGLLGCLLMGVEFARGLSLAHKTALVGVNHIEGHILSCLMDNSDLPFPYLCLVVSGGHTELQLVESPGNYKLIARTGDDAAGEAFDKSANLLGFEYPGGASLAALADQYGRSDFKLPRVMREAPGFSFSGLKTAIALLVQQHKDALHQESELRASLAYAIQESIVDALVFKLEQAAKNLGVYTIGVCGGVSANKMLRKKVSEIKGAQVFFPDFKHSLDNAAMIGFAGGLRYLKGERLDNRAEVLPRWPVESLSVQR